RRIGTDWIEGANLDREGAMDRETLLRKLVERHGNGDLDRRAFLSSIGAMALASGLVSGGIFSTFRQATAAQAVRFDSYGGVYQQAFDRLVLQPFTAKTGISVNQGSFGSPDDLLAKVQAEGLGTYNFFTAADESSFLRFINAGYTVALDESKIPR